MKSGTLSTGQRYVPLNTIIPNLLTQVQELIKVRGWQVSPTELETCLLTDPAIIDVAVVGVDFQDGRGELPRAYVVLDPVMADQVKDEEIQEYLNSRLANYKALAGGVRRLQEIPRSTSGKILKKILREQAKKEMEEGSRLQGVAIAETFVGITEQKIKEVSKSQGVIVTETILEITEMPDRPRSDF